MPINGPSLTVTQHTTVDQLQSFVRDNATAKDKILGKKDPITGHTTLYIGRKTSFKDMLTGKAVQRKAEAKTAVLTILHSSLQQTKSGRVLTQDESRAIDDLASSVTNRRNDTGNHGMKAGIINLLASAVQGAKSYGKAPGGPAKGPQLTDLGNFAAHVNTAGTGLSNALQNGTSMQAVADTLGDEIANAFRGTHPGADDRLAFAMSDGKDFKEQLLAGMKAGLGNPAGENLGKSQDVLAAIDSAFNRAAAQMLPNAEVGGNLITLNYVDKYGQNGTADLPKIILQTPTGPKEYAPEGFLGTGGFADVYSYKATDGSNEVIAYKVSKDNSPTAIDDVGGEVLAHSKMVGAGNANVLGLKGAIRTPDGRIGIALELAPNGDAFEFSQQLIAALGNGPGQVTNAQAELIRLTLFKDMAQGLSHIQETQGMIHLDFKSPNCLIGTDGTLKVADFGTSQEGDEFQLVASKVPDNPAWLSPELVLAKNDQSSIIDFEKPVLKQVAQSIDGQIRSLFPQATAKQVKFLKQNILLPHTKTAVEDLRVGNTSDTWALGMAASDLFTGTYFGHHNQFMSQTESQLKDFASNPNNVAVAPLGPNNQLPQGALIASTGNLAIDGVLNRLLDPNPDNRPDISVALQDRVFATAGVGSPEVRALILAVASGDANRIDQAKAALDLLLNPMPPLPIMPQQVGLPPQRPLPPLPGNPGNLNGN